MLAWQIWLIIAGICFVIEIITVGFLVLWFAIAALIVALLSLFISNVVAQTAIFLVISSVLILLTRPLTSKFTKNDNTPTNIQSIIGKTGIVRKSISISEPGQVKIGGDLWTAILEDNSNYQTVSEGSSVEVLKVDGVKVIVTPVHTTNSSELLTK